MTFSDEYVKVDGVHIDEQEALAAQDPTVGDGTPNTAPWIKTEEVDLPATKTKQRGLSPKVLANFITSLVVGAAGYFAVELSPEVSGAIAVVAGFLAGVIIGPGDVEEVPASE